MTDTLDQSFAELNERVDWVCAELDRLRMENTRLRTTIATVLECDCSTCFSCLSDLKSALKGATYHGTVPVRAHD